MKLNHIISIVFIGCFSLNTSAQQSPLFGFTSQLLSISNPAMSKSSAPLNITLAGRKYWTGIPFGPEAYIGSFSISPEAYKSALGGYFWRENAPMISKQMIGVNYAYAIKNMDENVNLRMGLGMDFISVSSNTNSVLTDDYNDPFYTALYSNNRSAADFRVGAVLNLSGLEIGAAVQQALKSKNNVGESVDGNLSFNHSTIVNGHLKYTIQAGENGKIAPMIFWQSQKNVPLRFDINLLAESTGKLWGGAWIRPKAAGGIMAGIWIVPEVKIGYMYEKTFFKGTSSAGRSHELLISYSPSFASKNKPEPKPEIPDVVEKSEPQVIRVIDTLVIVKEIRITETAKEPVAEEETPPARPKAETPPAKPKAETPPVKPKVETPPTTAGTFYVVSGMFTVKENADKYAGKLRGDGFSPQLVKSNTGGQYYVTLGKFRTREEAHAWVSKTPHGNYPLWVKEIR